MSFQEYCCSELELDQVRQSELKLLRKDNHHNRNVAKALTATDTYDKTDRHIRVA